MAKLDNYSCNGQMSIFDFMERDEPAILLKPGEHVWEVLVGDTFEYEVEDWTYLCGEKDRGYGLIDLESSNGDFHTYSRAWNSTIGVTIFKTFEEAMVEAKKNLEKVEHILAEDMVPKKVIAFTSNRWRTEYVEWYAELGDGLFYYRYGSMYDHIGSEKEIRKFKEKLCECEGVEVKDYHPTFKNMYKVDDKGWLYAGAKFFKY